MGSAILTIGINCNQGGNAMKNLAGQRFGRWTVIERAPDSITQKGYHNIMWKCVCDCGTEKNVRGKILTNGQSKSCGCLQKEMLSSRASKHRGFGTRLYAIWNSMRQRCNNPNHHAFDNYGGRGIKICPEWDDFSTFREWALFNGYDENAPRGEYTLDRINVDEGYNPNNCRWANMREQADNRRDTLIVHHNGETHPLTVWAEILNINYCTLWKQYKQGKSVLN